MYTTTPPQPPKVIAEIGCNHMGKMEIAFDLIQQAAKLCGADVVKFQKRTNKELLSPEEYNRPHPVPQNAYGPTYGAHREFLELDQAQHRDLKAYCEEQGIVYSTSVWDLTAAKEMAALEPKLLKVPSACNLNKELMSFLCDEFAGEIHVSTGMTTLDEVARVVELVESKGRAKDTVLYACTSGYPVPFEDIALGEIVRLKERFGSTLKAIGFSGHHLGIAADVAAMVLGAEWIERHFTGDRTWKGTDHAASLEPMGMRKLVRDLHNVSKALTVKASPILPIEEVQRAKLKANQVKW
ncbi:MAG: N-acetylneuraminate synthase [Deltaproteobacteria bacterium]|nr:MAG: N-acetylneuraminate synthase [Deltaproteobacteria bacterium]